MDLVFSLYTKVASAGSAARNSLFHLSSLLITSKGPRKQEKRNTFLKGRFCLPGRVERLLGWPRAVPFRAGLGLADSAPRGRGRFMSH